MFKTISSKIAARQTIKAQLERELPPINDAIKEAKEAGKLYTHYDGEISKVTFKLLTKAGYCVENWNVWNATTRIDWCASYHKISDSAEEVVKIAQEADIKIVEVQ